MCNTVLYFETKLHGEKQQNFKYMYKDLVQQMVHKKVQQKLQQKVQKELQQKVHNNHVPQLIKQFVFTKVTECLC